MRYLVCLIVAIMASMALANTSITYQGQITNAGEPYDEAITMTFELFDEMEGGNSVAGPLTPPPIAVSNGLFAVELDFGAVIDDSPIYLQITVGAQILNPRQRITAAPVAIHALGTTIIAGAGIQTVGNQVALTDCPQGQILVSQGTGWGCTEILETTLGFDEDAAPDTYPMGISWQTGQGSNAPQSSACQHGIVKTMRVSLCRTQQVCYEREGDIRTRTVDPICSDTGWGAWNTLSPN